MVAKARTCLVSVPSPRRSRGVGVGASWLLHGMAPDARLLSVEAEPAIQAIAAEHLCDDPRSPSPRWARTGGWTPAKAHASRLPKSTAARANSTDCRT